MAKYNHIIDPSYFDDCIEQFSFTYDWYHITGLEVDDLGNQKNTFTKMDIVGSLQPQANNRQSKKEGMVETRNYNFYCKSIYRIDSGDFICYNNDWLICTSVEPYDEYGVRKVSLESANPTMYRDLMEAEKCLTGEIIP